MSNSSFGGSITGTVVDIKSDDNDKSKNKKNQTLKSEVGTSVKASSSIRRRTSMLGKTESSKNNEIGAKVMLRHGFGSTALSVDGIQSFSTLLGDKDVNDRVIYKIGCNVSIHDPETGRQQYVSGRPKDVIDVLHFSVSDNNRYISICETTRNAKDRISNGNGNAQASNN